MRRAYIKALAFAIPAAVAFLVAAIILIHMIWFDVQLSAHSAELRGARRVEAHRAYAAVNYNDVPAILFLCLAGIALGILAIRFYNHAKSDFAD